MPHLVSSPRSTSVARFRPGEEAATIPFTKRIIAQSGGGGVVELSLLMESAPVPERRYTADGVLVGLGKDDVRVVFGQFQLDGTSLRSILIVKLSFDAVHIFLKGCEQVLPQLRTLVMSNAMHQPEPLELPSKEPSQVVVFSANILAAGYMGREANLDVFSASAFAFRSANNGNALPVDPVVRVDLSTGTLLSMMEQVERLKDGVPEAIVGVVQK